MVISGIHVGIAWIMRQVAARRRNGQVLIALMDGQVSLWETMKLHFNFGGACRHLVKDRMERSGMRWTLEGARSMLNVRAAFQSDHWRTFVDWDMKNEITRTHPNKNLLQGYTPERLAC